MKIQRWTGCTKGKVYRIKNKLKYTYNGDSNDKCSLGGLHMNALMMIREKNKRSDSFLQAKIKEPMLTNEEYEEGRMFFENVVEQINNATLKEYLKRCKNQK
ncbi:hypothetical protein CLOHAE12215_01390 [Clostridium haemolyticum]|uniref:hypothetical protein n=1 Tax=Clostridium TaxID=1485 RepID=UPI001C3B2648|nr:MULTISPECIES: hypothetical protein [Clostridium]MCD3218084.1 hypothetical protein [Clostridium botulinum C]MCD3245322.1 hypothetical protein [Clostridium botulinum C]MCD3261701.1 hypothetical protein [Clostridium botulinum C]CAG7839974.1 hypothetical protein CLOHAE12215_01390 [Clostridium haemolyticum]